MSQPTDQEQARLATHLVCNFDKEAEALRGLEEQPGGNVLAEVLGLGAGLHLEGLGEGGSLGSGCASKETDPLLCKTPPSEGLPWVQS